MIFPKISGLCQEQALAYDLLEILREVYTSNFLIVMLDLKLRIKAGTSKNRCNRISEQIFVFSYAISSFAIILTWKIKHYVLL